MSSEIHNQPQSTTQRPRRWLQAAVLLFFVGLVTWLSPVAAADLQNVRRVSLGSGSVQADNSSFFVTTSADGRYVTFESWASNWNAADPRPNKVDVFVRDTVADTTVQVTFGDDDSFDPIITADGRYVVFNSYAADLVPGDNNSDVWLRDGLDLFLYDRVANTLQRVSLNDKDKEIDGNSLGTITPDGNLVIFASNGKQVLTNEANGLQRPALYVRDWRTGSISRVTIGIDAPNAFPNGAISGARASYDGRYIVYNADASNLVPGDTNEEGDIFLYDRNSGSTTRVSQPPGGGNANGRSFQADITQDGRYVIFKSFADNLVPNDANGEADIFLYTIASGDLQLVSLAHNGAQGNAEAKDPSICSTDEMVLVTFTSEATNLVPGDGNGQRDIFMRDVLNGETTVVTINAQGEWGNGRAHRSYLSPDCTVVNYATEASNAVANDTNDARDIFAADIVQPADLSSSSVVISGSIAPGGTLTYTYTLRNSGGETAAAAFSATIPSNTSYVASSVSGASYSSGAVSWNGNLAGGATRTITFQTTINAGLTNFTLLSNSASLSGDGSTLMLNRVLAVNGMNTYLPIVGKP